MAFQLKIEKVLISDNLDNCCHEILTKNGIEVKAETKLGKDELLAEIPVSKFVPYICEVHYYLMFANIYVEVALW